jgi:hypothetical protein
LGKHFKVRLDRDQLFHFNGRDDPLDYAEAKALDREIQRGIRHIEMTHLTRDTDRYNEEMKRKSKEYDEKYSSRFVRKGRGALPKLVRERRNRRVHNESNEIKAPEELPNVKIIDNVLPPKTHTKSLPPPIIENLPVSLKGIETDFLPPKLGTEGVLSCWRYHSSRRCVPNKVPDSDVLESVASFLLSEFDLTKVKVPDIIRTPALLDDLPTFSNYIDSQLEGLVNSKSGPGYPFSINYPTCGALIRNPVGRVELVKTIYERLLSLFSAKEDNIYGYTTVFIKNEYHPRLKVEQGRFRDIKQCDVADLIIHKLIHKNMISSASENPRKFRTKIGCDMNTTEGCRELYDSFMELKSNGEKVYESDVSSWDWNFRDWMFHVCFSALCKVADAVFTNDAEKDRFYIVTSNICHNLTYSKYVFPDGTVRTYDIPGIMNSGILYTSFFNSLGNIAMNMIARYECGGGYVCKGIFYGDDSVISLPHDIPPLKYLTKFNDYGIALKELVPVNDFQFNFCSRCFLVDKSYLVNYQRVFLNHYFSYPKVEEDKVEKVIGFYKDLRFHPLYNIMQDVLVRDYVENKHGTVCQGWAKDKQRALDIIEGRVDRHVQFLVNNESKNQKSESKDTGVREESRQSKVTTSGNQSIKKQKKRKNRTSRKENVELVRSPSS